MTAADIAVTVVAGVWAVATVVGLGVYRAAWREMAVSSRVDGHDRAEVDLEFRAIAALAERAEFDELVTAGWPDGVDL